MDLVSILKSQLLRIPMGPHTPGLQAVLRHIEVAFQHLNRGENANDASPYTDAVYRANQAFEGSIKEAYRVIAGKDPQKESPYNIEQYFEERGILRERVLALFSNYRRAWRNPSTHDYRLEFDSNEAFLAAISVSAFAKLLLDEIASRLASDAVRSSAIKSDLELGKLIDRSIALALAMLCAEFLTKRAKEKADVFQLESQLIGATSEFISAEMAHARVLIEPKVEPFHARVDMMVTLPSGSVLAEFKSKPLTESALNMAMISLAQMINIAGVGGGALIAYDPNASEYKVIETPMVVGPKLYLVQPKTR